MLTYIAKRLLAMIPTLLGITVITFILINLAPGDPVAAKFQGTGGSERGAEGGGQNRLKDNIRAKKKLLGMVREDRAVRRWDLVGVEAGSGDDLDRMDLEASLGKFEGWPRAMAVSGDGARMHVAGDDLVVRTLDASGTVLHERRGHQDTVWALAVSADGALLATGDGAGVLRFWDAESEAMRGTPVNLGSFIRALCFLPNGRGLVVGSSDGTLRLLDVPSGREVRRFEGHVSSVFALAVDPDGRRFWSAGQDRMLREWSLAGGAARELDEHGAAIEAIALTPDGRSLITGCSDRRVRIVDVASGETTEMEGHYGAVTSVAVSPDGRLAISGSRDETLRAWDLATREQVGEGEQTTGTTTALAVLSSGAVLSVGESWSVVPVWRRFLTWLGRVVTLDFDRSFIDGRPVIEKIAAALPVTMGLNGLAFLIIYIVAIPLGIMAAVRRGTTFDHVTSVLLFALYSLPSFWVGTLLVIAFSSKLNWDILPAVGLHSDGSEDLSYFAWLWDWFLHLIMPVATITYASFASLSQFVRTSMLETIGQDYVRTARAKGLSENVVIYKHALRNSLITVITIFAALLPAMIGGSVVVEYIFSIRGMGKLGFDAILQRDYPVIMAVTTFGAFLTLLGILASDILYSVADPRIRHE